MSFIRIKKIGNKNGKKYEYGYVVENKWRKRLKKGKGGSRQKVSKYLGKVLRLENIDEKIKDCGDDGFFEFIGNKDIEEYLKNKKRRIVNDLIRYELSLRGFDENKGIIERGGIRYELKQERFVNSDGEDEKVLIEMNEGFLCRYTIRKLINFKARDEDERENGVKLAKAFLGAGLRVPKEIFVGYFEKV
ncbi:MAG: hypothetical protein KAK00_08160 [Nanoarchaeota archaeon]|nr:hypothetical protein [Nanoarchaeota archaeon]